MHYVSLRASPRALHEGVRIVCGVKTGGNGVAYDLKAKIHIWNDIYTDHKLPLCGSLGGWVKTGSVSGRAGVGSCSLRLSIYISVSNIWES